MASRAALAIVLVLAFAWPPLPADAREAGQPTDYAVKAAFLYNFTKFVTWPEARASAPVFVVAVLGNDPFDGLLERMLAGKTVLDRKVTVSHVRTVEEASRAHIVFVSSSESARVDWLVKALQSASVLTVGDLEGFADRGGMIAFEIVDDRVRFDINLAQVEKAHLKMSSQLIRLARRVVSGNK